jgi:TonB family protein
MRRFIGFVALAAAALASASCSSAAGVKQGADSVRVPTVTNRVAPDYPLELRQQGVHGSVEIGGTVPKEGGVLRKPHVIRSDDSRLDQLALDAVSRWTWKPGLQDGKPVDVEFTMTVTFH